MDNEIHSGVAFRPSVFAPERPPRELHFPERINQLLARAEAGLDLWTGEPLPERLANVMKSLRYKGGSQKDVRESLPESPQELLVGEGTEPACLPLEKSRSN